MSELFTQDRPDLDLLRRAFRSSDHTGEAALNGLLYAAGALVTSAVLLVTTAPAILGIAVAIVPWVLFGAAAWWWISPAVEREVLDRRIVRSRLLRAADLAADLVLLEEGAPPEQRRLAVAFLSRDLDPDAREAAAERLLGLERPAS